ncbi:hypothetical protein RKE93_28885 [Klebsiella pneumoniae]|nr:hypothetical protein [Klebsiella pneumoniae]
MNKVAKSLRQNNGDLAITVQAKNGSRKIEVFKLKHVNRNRTTIVDTEPRTAHITTRTTEIMRRLGARICEYCAKTGRCEVHHVRKLKDLKKGRKAGYKPQPVATNDDRTPPENDDFFVRKLPRQVT